MKIKITCRKNAGSVLLVCLGGAVIIGIGLVSILSMVQGENTSTSRSQVWNQSLVMAEAGIEEGMSLINKNVSTASAVSAWPSTATADGWTQSGNVFRLNRNFDEGYCDMYVTNLDATTASIKCTGAVRWTNGAVATISRAVLVTAKLASGFQGAIATKSTLRMSGGFIDSFNSANPLYSTNGVYTLSKRAANGNVLVGISNGVSAVGLNMSGSARIYGKASTGPNYTFAIGSSLIGDTNWTGPGVQPGYTNGNANVLIPDAPALPTPPFLWSAMPARAGGICVLDGGGVGHTNYYQMLSGFGNISGGQALFITNGSVVLDVEFDFQISGSGYSYIAPNANLTAWFNGNPTISGSGLLNGSGNATNCTLYGTTNCTAITFSGGANYVGTIYAPYAATTWSGSAEISGAAVLGSLNNSGGANFHFDENLLGGASGAYIVTSWREVPP